MKNLYTCIYAPHKFKTNQVTFWRCVIGSSWLDIQYMYVNYFFFWKIFKRKVTCVGLKWYMHQCILRCMGFIYKCWHVWLKNEINKYKVAGSNLQENVYISPHTLLDRIVSLYFTLYKSIAIFIFLISHWITFKVSLKSMC